MHELKYGLIIELKVKGHVLWQLIALVTSTESLFNLPLQTKLYSSTPSLFQVCSFPLLVLTRSLFRMESNPAQCLGAFSLEL